MTCRAPSASSTCTGTPTGATLAFDTEGRLSSWAGGTTTDSFLYDGAGNRVEQQTTLNGSFTTSTTYVDGGQEEISATTSTNGIANSAPVLTKYFPSVSGAPTAERVGTNGPLSYLASDGQGSVSEALDSNGSVVFQQLYTPYGQVRYSQGTSPTSYAYTGQLADSATGLDYDHARYYDAVAGQFVSADTVSDGLSGYGYTGGNPTTMVDPTGHKAACFNNDCGQAPPPPPPPPPPSGCRGTGDCGGGGGGCTHDCGGGCTKDCDNNGNTLSALQIGGICQLTDRGCFLAIINKWINRVQVMAGYFAQDVLPMLAALAFAIFDFFQLADANVLEFLNFAADLASTLSGVVNVIKDGSILFGWGGSGFQNVMTILTTLDKGASAIVQFARAILGGAYALAMFFNPASAIENMVKVVIKKFRFQVIEALLGGVIFGGVDTAYATVSGLQALSIVVNSAPTKDLPEWCNRLGLQC